MRVEPRRRLHRDQRQQLEQMVRHHVAQRAGGVIETAAVADAELLVDRDLDVIDVIAIPDRLEHAVGEAQHQDVLDGFLAEIMVDPVDLVLVDDLQQFAIQCLGRGEIGSERLFDHQPPPRAVVLPEHAGAAKFAADRRKRVRRRRQIEQPVAAGLAFCLEFFELLAHRSNEAGSSGSAAMQVTQSSRRLAISSSTLRVANWCRPFIRLSRRSSFDIALAGDADDAEIIRQQIGCRQIVQRGNHEAMGEIAGNAENNEGAGVGFFLVGCGVCHGRPAFGFKVLMVG